MSTTILLVFGNRDTTTRGLLSVGSVALGFVWHPTLAPAERSSSLLGAKGVQRLSYWGRVLSRKATCPHARPSVERPACPGKRTLALTYAPGPTSHVWPVHYGVELCNLKQTVKAGVSIIGRVLNRKSNGQSTFNPCNLALCNSLLSTCSPTKVWFVNTCSGIAWAGVKLRTAQSTPNVTQEPKTRKILFAILSYHTMVSVS